MALEAQRVADFVYDRLAADATFMGAIGGRLKRDMLAQDVALPAGIVGPVISAPDTTTLGGRRSHATVSLDVHLIAAGTSYAPINAAAERADLVLDGSSGPKGNTYVVRLRRDDTRPYPETESGASFRHIVLTYRTEAHALP